MLLLLYTPFEYNTKRNFIVASTIAHFVHIDIYLYFFYLIIVGPLDFEFSKTSMYQIHSPSPSWKFLMVVQTLQNLNRPGLLKASERAAHPYVWPALSG